MKIPHVRRLDLSVEHFGHRTTLKYDHKDFRAKCGPKTEFTQGDLETIKGKGMRDQTKIINYRKLI